MNQDHETCDNEEDATSSPAELLKPIFLQPEDKFEIKILEGGVCINLGFWFICYSAMRRPFQVEPSVNRYFGTKQVPHNNKPNLPHEPKNTTALITTP